MLMQNCEFGIGISYVDHKLLGPWAARYPMSIHPEGIDVTRRVRDILQDGGTMAKSLVTGMTQHFCSTNQLDRNAIVLLVFLASMSCYLSNPTTEENQQLIFLWSNIAGKYGQKFMLQQA